MSDKCSSRDSKEETYPRNSLVGKTTKFPLLCLEQDSGDGRSCSCPTAFLQRCPTAALSRNSLAPYRDGAMGKREFFSELSHSGAPCHNHQKALPFLGALDKPQVQHNKATQWAVPSVRNACHSANQLLWGKRGPGKCLPHPSCRA